MKLLNINHFEAKLKEERKKILKEFCKLAMEDDYCILLTDEHIFFINADDKEIVYRLEDVKNMVLNGDLVRVDEEEDE